MRIALTGSTGFVGINMKYILKNKYEIVDINLRELSNYKIEDDISIVIHLAGIAHDLKNTKNDNLYYEVNTNLTKKIFDSFLESNAETFIFLSSIKAVCDKTENIIDENFKCNPKTVYGKSKLLAEEYIQSKILPNNKRFFILRPSLIYGIENKGNLNLLLRFVKSGLPWPFINFNNKKSFCGIDNLCFVIDQLIMQKNISSDIYNIADSECISTNDLVSIIANTQKKTFRKLFIPKWFIISFAKLGNLFNLPFNTHTLEKIIENYLISNKKVLKAIGKKMPYTTFEGIIKSFLNN